MRRLWLIFAQTVTVSLAFFLAFFCFSSLFQPQWLDGLRQLTSGRDATAPAGQPAPSIRTDSFRTAASRALPTVVYISTTQKVKANPHNPLLGDPLFRRFFGENDENGENEQDDNDSKTGLGSGVIASADGYVLTNYHVVEGAEEIEVTQDNGQVRQAKAIGGDPETDLAVLKLEVGADEKISFPAIEFGDMDKVAVGDVALAVGNPFGVGQTVTMGIVSALGRSHLGLNTFENFIQTDAAINPGNSGGALVDVDGRLIGINTAIYSRSGGSLGIGFAIPASTARSIMEQIIRDGSVTRGWIGVEVQEITPELADSLGLQDTSGALIAGVLRGSPADKGGVKPGDVLLAVAGRPVKDPQTMLNLIAALKPGETVPFSLRRQKDVWEAKLLVGKRPPPNRNRD